MAKWPSIRQRPMQIQRQFKGVNKLDTFNLNPEYATDMSNLSITDSSVLTTRPGYTVVGGSGTKVLGMGIWRETELHVVFNTGEWWRLNANATWSLLAGGLSTTAEWAFTNAKLNLSDIALIGSNGVNGPYYYVGGSSLTTLTAPTGIKYVTQFADRLFGAVGNELHYTAYRIANDWTTVNGDEADSGYIVIESPDGEQINSIQGGLTKLTITKPSALYGLFGYSPSDYAVRPATIDIGQFNQKSGLTYEGWLYQISDAGFHQFPGSGAPNNNFSQPVRSYFQNINKTAKGMSALGTDMRKVYASIPVTSSTAPDTVIEFDPKRGTFAPWQGISALHFAYVQGKFYVGDAQGRVLLLGGTSDAGTAISGYWISKPFAAESLAQNIRWFKMYVTLDLPVGSAFSVYLSPSDSGNSDWVQSGGTITGVAGVQRKTIYFPSNILPPTKNIRVKFAFTGQMTLYEFAFEQDNMPLV